MQVGIPVDHHLLHFVEAGGLAVAVVGTIAATVGELLAVRAIWKVQREKKQAQLDAAATAAVAAWDEASGETARLQQQQQQQQSAGYQGPAVQQLAHLQQQDIAVEKSDAASSSSSSSSVAGNGAATTAEAQDAAGWQWDDGTRSLNSSSNDGSRSSNTAGQQECSPVYPTNSSSDSRHTQPSDNNK